MRIVSLLPSATEIVCALGYEHALVGRSHECDFPRGIERLPVCTEAKVSGALTSEEIHARVGAILEHDLSVYRVDAALLREVAPTHIVTQIQCDVCAVSLRDVEAAIANWTGIDAPRIVPLNPGCLEDVFADLQRTAHALHDDAAGEALVSRMRESMRAIECIARDANDKPRVATIEWLAPLMTAGNWAPELVRLAGGIDLLGEEGKHSDWLRWEQLIAADPDLVVVFPCGFGLQEIHRDLHHLTSNAGWRSLRAVRNGDVFLIDGNQYLNRPGPRLVESLEILAEIFHPDRFDFGHEGKAWVQWKD